MKKLFTLGALLFAGTAFAQTENVGIGTAQPDKSAILDLSSSNKGFLLPRMSESQRLNIVKPAQGLQVYQTDGTVGLYVYNGKDWENASKSVAAATDPWLRGGNDIVAGEYLGTSATSTEKALRFKTNGVNSGLIDPVSLNLAFGYEALLNVGASTNNTAIGTSALKTMSNSGGGNLALGAFAMETSNGAVQNVAVGEGTLRYNVTGLRNTAVGRGALENSGNSDYNTALGWNAGVYATGTNNVYIGALSGALNNQNGKLFIHSSSTDGGLVPLIGGDFNNYFLKFHTGTAAPTATAGFVAIGDFSAAGSTSTPGTGAINSFPGFTAGSKYRLVVQDGILTEKLKVALRNGTDWADYVFQPDYKLMPLENVESFIKTNKHLPNVPSAEEMAKNGLDVLQTSAKLMEKIEELTLYLIELKKEVASIKQENKNLKDKLK